MSTDICLDAYVDWETTVGGGHYDRRQGRNCKPGSGFGGTITEPSNFNGRPVTGLQKAAGCRYEQVPSAHLGTCDYDTEGESNCYFSSALAWTSKCAATLVRHEDGTTDFEDGGDVDVCGS